LRRADCHPGRKHYAKGLCSTCYSREFRMQWSPTKPATCHPDRPVRSRGLCSPCYQKLKASPEWVSVGRATASITCGHKDKRHAGNGMCGACLSRSRRERDIEGERVKRRDYQLRAKYGIGLDGFEKLLKSQGGVCALCRGQFKSDRDRHVDHCHETGRVRGILCFSCNKGLGLLGDNIEGMRRAINYLAAQAGVFIPEVA
jgi:hypothetical protein